MIGQSLEGTQVELKRRGWWMEHWGGVGPLERTGDSIQVMVVLNAFTSGLEGGVQGLEGLSESDLSRLDSRLSGGKCPCSDGV